MRKLFLLVLALASCPLLRAQVEISYDENFPASRSDDRFAPPPLPNRFIFYMGVGQQVRVEMNNLLPLRRRLPDLDSLGRAVWAALAPFRDSLTRPLVSRRVDYHPERNGSAQFRIIEYEPRGTAYRIAGNDTSVVKVESDTLRVYLSYIDSSENRIRFLARDSFRWILPATRYVVTYILNNLNDLDKLNGDGLRWGMQVLREDLAEEIAKEPRKTRLLSHSAGYNVDTRFRPKPGTWRFGWRRRRSFQPTVEAGIQYVRGAWVPSAGAGLQLILKKNAEQQTDFRLQWEPHFVFGTGNAGQTVLQRNDFITFKAHDEWGRRNDREPRWSQSFAIGYLVNRNGGFYEPGTVKFALPGLDVRNIRLEPEFFFNDLFKNFSPSLKLTLLLE